MDIIEQNCELLQIDARGGTRYFEILRAHFGIALKKGKK